MPRTRTETQEAPSTPVFLELDTTRFCQAVKNCAAFCDGGGTYGRFIHIYTVGGALRLTGGENCNQSRIIMENIDFENDDDPYEIDTWVPVDYINPVAKSLKGEKCQIAFHEGKFRLTNGEFVTSANGVSISNRVMETLEEMNWGEPIASGVPLKEILTILDHVEAREGISGSKSILVTKDKSLSYNSLCFSILDKGLGDCDSSARIQVPKSFAKLASILEPEVEISISERWIMLAGLQRIIYIGKEGYQIDASFLTSESRLPFSGSVTISREDLLAELTKIEAATSRGGHSARINISKTANGNPVVSFDSAEENLNAAAKIEGIGEGEFITNALISVRWLMESLKALGNDNAANVIIKVQPADNIHCIGLRGNNLFEIIPVMIEARNPVTSEIENDSEEDA